MAAARGPREEPEPSSADNVRLQKTVTGTTHKQVGDSSFYAKHGIQPIGETLDHSARSSSIDPESPIKMKNMRKLHEGSTKFPKLAECAHFHYDFTELGSMVVSICEDNQENFHHQTEPPPGEVVFYLTVFSNERPWVIRRTHNDFKIFDKQLHKCIFDRKFSLLPDLRRNENAIAQDGVTALRKLLALYLRRFSSIAGNMINCGPILSWLEMDNRGNRLMVTDDSEINTPAISAGHVVRRYTGQAPDELTIQVGDIISIIDMPPGDETAWWRGKNQYQVGFFPCECVELISDKSIPQSMEGIIIPETNTKPVLRKRGKLISFLRAFFSSRPARAQLQRTGIVKQRIFGCDLGEHLSNLGLEDGKRKTKYNSDPDGYIPKVLTSCAVVIEEHGIVDGIYRLSGVASNIQKLRNDFDDEKEPCLTDEVYLQDIHSISSLLKAYFRELPNPLLTYQLYHKFSEAVSVEEHKLIKIHDVIQQLPPPHYRTAEHLFKHLNRVSRFGKKTGMHCKNLAIVWAPNLMRSKELESMCNTAMLQGVGVQAIVTELLIQYADLIFSDTLQNVPTDTGSIGRRQRPKSLAISTPTKLLSLEEAREQMLTGNSGDSPKQKFIEVGGGPNNLPKDFHTVIELPTKKKSRKDRRSPALPRDQSVQQGGSGWKSIFSRKKQDSMKSSTSEARVSTQLSEPEVSKHRKLRTVRSADSLISSSNSSGAGKSKPDRKMGKDEDFPAVHPKALQSGRGDSRRTMSYDLTHSESDLSDQEGMVISMEAEVPRPASATAELTGPRPEFMSEMEHTLSVKTKVKKGKIGKELKKSKKKQRSASAGQPIEGIPSTADVSLHSRSKSTSHTDPHTHYPPPEPSPVVIGGHPPPPPSPSLKDRLVQALTPTSPRKRIKGPAPSPPQSPPTTFITEGAAKIKKKSVSSSKSKSLPSKTVPTFVDRPVQKHSNSEKSTDHPLPAQPSDPHQGASNASRQQAESSHLYQLSPIEEALNSDMSSTPDVEHQILAAKLQQSHLQNWSSPNYPPPETGPGSGSFGSLNDEEVFQEMRVNQSNHSTRYSTQSLGQYDNQPHPTVYDQYQPVQSDYNQTRPDMPHVGCYGDRNSKVGGGAEGGNLQREGEMSMSLDSLLKEVVGSDSYNHSEFGSSASFKTFGKSSTQMDQSTEQTSSKEVMPTAQQPPPVPERSHDTVHHIPHDLAGYRTEDYGLTGSIHSGSSYHYEDDYITEKQTDQTSFHMPVEEEEAGPGMIDRSLATPTSTGSVLETDLDDSCDVTADTPEEFLAPEERVTVHRQDLSPGDQDDEGRHYVAPLPGDIQMMSHYPDLIPHHVLPSQIDLLDTDVQYVDPRQESHFQDDNYAALHQPPPDVSLEADSTAAQTNNAHHYEDYNTQTHASVQFEKTLRNEPEPMVSPDRSYNKPLPVSPPDIAMGAMVGQPLDDLQFDLRPEPGHIVIRTPLDESPEGSTFIPVKTRVVPPPRQFAYSAHPASDYPEEDLTPPGGDIGNQEVTETAIDTPSDEYPLPPPPTEAMVADGYLADRSGSASPTNTMETRDNFLAKLKAAASQPVTIDEEVGDEVAMVISPTCSISKTPESDNIMVTSSVESDGNGLLRDFSSNQEQGFISGGDDRVYPREEEEPVVALGGHLLSETMESELVFQMDDVKSKSSSLSKSIESLQNLSMSSEDALEGATSTGASQEGLDLVIREGEGGGDNREYSIEDTQSQVGYYFTYDKGLEENAPKPESEDFSRVMGQFPNVSTEALVSTITVEEVDQQKLPDNSHVSTHKPVDHHKLNNSKATLVERVQLEEEEDKKPGKKPTPVRRKKSVKELLSRFEGATSSGSPPSDHDSSVGGNKSKPQVFQKPRVVRLHSLNRSSDMEDSQDTEVTTPINKSPPKRDEQLLMSASCPDASRLLSLSPREIDLEEDVTPSSMTLNRSNPSDNVKSREPPAVSKKPSVRNKIQKFESSESLTSDSEQLSKSVSPSRVTNRDDSQAKTASKDRAFSPIPPAKPVIIHERTSPKPVDHSSLSSSGLHQTGSIHTFTSVKEDNKSKYSFSPSQSSDSSPKFSRRSSGGGSGGGGSTSGEVKTPASFQLRSASAGLSNSILKESSKSPVFKAEEDANPPSDKKLQSLTERMRRFQSTSEEETPSNNNTTTPKEGYSSMDRGFNTRASGTYHNRRASAEPTQLDASTPQPVPRTTSTTTGIVVLSKDSTEDSSTSIASQDFTRSSSVPNHAFNSGTRLSYKSTPVARDSGVAMDTDEGVAVLKPSQLFSRKARKSSDTPSVLSQSLGRDQYTGDVGGHTNAKEDSSIMSSSFSDRRKLFESSTDSGISTSSYGSLKHAEVFAKPKQSTESNAKRNDSNNVTSHHETNSLLSSADITVTTATSTPRQQQQYPVTDTDYTNKIRQFGNKTVVIESSDNSKSSTGSHKHSGSAGHTVATGNGNLSNRAKPYERDQKENVKPAATTSVFKSKEKESSGGAGLGGKERGGTVKDLWRKFEQQNT